MSVEASIEGSSTSTETALPACRDSQSMVVFSVFGAATEGDGDVSSWANDPEIPPAARSGAAEVAAAYQDLGYHLLYVALEPADTPIGDQQLIEAITVWLGLNDFPIGGYDTHVWAWDGEGSASVALTEQLTREATDGTEFGAGYVGDADLVIPFVTGGIPRESMYTVDAPDSGETSTSLPGDLSDHVPDVKELDPVCE